MSKSNTTKVLAFWVFLAFSTPHIITRATRFSSHRSARHDADESCFYLSDFV
jgi:hypothetical protein